MKKELLIAQLAILLFNNKREGGNVRKLDNMNISKLNKCCDLIGTSNSFIDLKNSNLSNKDLSCSNLEYVDFSYSDLSNLNLSCSNIKIINFKGANLSGADLSDLDLRGCNFEDAILDNTNLSKSDLRSANLKNVNLSQANVEEALYDPSTIIDTPNKKMYYLGPKTDLKGANLSNINLNDVDLSYSDLSNANFKDSSMIDANLKGCKLEETNFTNVNLENAILNKCTIANTIFFNTNINNAVITNITIKKADFVLSLIDQEEFDQLISNNQKEGEETSLLFETLNDNIKDMITNIINNDFLEEIKVLKNEGLTLEGINNFLAKIKKKYYFKKDEIFTQEEINDFLNYKYQINYFLKSITEKYYLFIGLENFFKKEEKTVSNFINLINKFNNDVNDFMLKKILGFKILGKPKKLDNKIKLELESLVMIKNNDKYTPTLDNKYYKLFYQDIDKLLNESKKNNIIDIYDIRNLIENLIENFSSIDFKDEINIKKSLITDLIIDFLFIFYSSDLNKTNINIIPKVKNLNIYYLASWFYDFDYNLNNKIKYMRSVRLNKINSINYFTLFASENIDINSNVYAFNKENWIIINKSYSTFLKNERKVLNNFEFDFNTVMVRNMGEGDPSPIKYYLPFNLAGINFRNIDIKNCILDHKNIKNTYFENCDLSNVSFKYVFIKGAKFENCNINKCNFTKANTRSKQFNSPLSESEKYYELLNKLDKSDLKIIKENLNNNNTDLIDFLSNTVFSDFSIYDEETISLFYEKIDKKKLNKSERRKIKKKIKEYETILANFRGYMHPIIDHWGFAFNPNIGGDLDVYSGSNPGGYWLYNERLKFHKVKIQNSNLAAIEFMGSEIVFSEFKNCNMKMANLWFSDLEGTIFEKTKLHFTILSNTYLKDIKMKEVEIIYVILNNLNFENVQITNSLIKNCKLINTNLKNVNLTNTTIERCNLNNSNFLGANLTNCILKENNINGLLYNSKTIFPKSFNKKSNTYSEENNEGMYYIDKNSYLENVEIINADLRYQDLSYANLKNANLERSDLRGVNLEKATLENTNFKHCLYDDKTIFPKSFNKKENTYSDENRKGMYYIGKGSFLKFAEFRNINFGECDLRNTNLKFSYFRDCILSNKSKLKGADMGGAMFDGNICKNVDFRGVNLNFIKSSSSSNFSYSNFEGCDLMGIWLPSFIFDGSNMKSTKIIGNLNFQNYENVDLRNSLIINQKKWWFDTNYRNSDLRNCIFDSTYYDSTYYKETNFFSILINLTNTDLRQADINYIDLNLCNNNIKLKNTVFYDENSKIYLKKTLEIINYNYYIKKIVEGKNFSSFKLEVNDFIVEKRDRAEDFEMVIAETTIDIITMNIPNGIFNNIDKITFDEKKINLSERIMKKLSVNPSLDKYSWYNFISNKDIKPESLTIKIVGYQWYWGVEYPDYNIFIDVYEDLENGSYVDNYIVLPINTPIRVLSTSYDVRHILRIPEIDLIGVAFPGRITKCQIIIKEEGIFKGNCMNNNFIGHLLTGDNYDYNEEQQKVMFEEGNVNCHKQHIAVKGVTMEEFKKWIKKKENEY